VAGWARVGGGSSERAGETDAGSLFPLSQPKNSALEPRDGDSVFAEPPAGELFAPATSGGTSPAGGGDVFAEDGPASLSPATRSPAES
jgi:hypothetical protein